MGNFPSRCKISLEWDFLMPHNFHTLSGLRVSSQSIVMGDLPTTMSGFHIPGTGMLIGFKSLSLSSMSPAFSQ